MDKTQTILGVLTLLYGAYIGIALWNSRSRGEPPRGARLAARPGGAPVVSAFDRIGGRP